VGFSSRLCRTRPGFSTVYVDRQDGTSDAFGRRVRGRDTHRRRGVRISGGPGSRRLLPERRFPTATRVHTSGAVEEQPHHQDQWVHNIISTTLTVRLVWGGKNLDVWKSVYHLVHTYYFRLQIYIYFFYRPVLYNQSC